MLYEHFIYGEWLAEHLAAIRHTASDPHFFRATEQTSYNDLLNSISSAHGVILIAIDDMNARLSFSAPDSLIEFPKYTFLILRETNSDDIDSLFAAQSECRQIALQIIARMKFDSLRYSDNGMNNLDENSFQISGAGPVSDNFYGVELSFSFNNGIDYHVNADFWT
jgi:hypothetical protein